LRSEKPVYREGGARGDIGVCDPKEWIFVVEPKQTISSDSAQVVRIGSAAKQTKTDDSLLYTKKEPLLTLSTKEINPPQEQTEPPKPDRKAQFGMAQLLGDNPHNVPEQLLADWLTQRKAKRAAVTATVWSTVNTELAKCAEARITADDAITEALNSGWQGFKASWVIKRLAEAASTPAPQSRHSTRRRSRPEIAFDTVSGWMWVALAISTAGMRCAPVLKFKVAFATYRTIFISRADKSMAIKPSIIWLSIRVNPRGLCIGTMFGMTSLA
jgi:hypothetical protein